MKKSKSLAKFLSVTLAATTLCQSGFVRCEARAESSKTPTSTKVLGTLVGISGVAVIGLTCGIIIEAIKNDNNEFEICVLKNKMKAQKKRIDDLEANLRECGNDNLDNPYEKSVNTELLRSIAKDWIKLCQTSSEPTLKESLEVLKHRHGNRDFTENDIVTILSATISHESEIRNHCNYEGWLKDCGLNTGCYYTNIRYHICRSDLKTIAKQVRDWEYKNRVYNSLEKNRFLDRFCKILSA